MYRYPFGQPVTARPPTQHRGGLFVLGAYPSALHVRWLAPDRTVIAALAVDDEPVPFWDGDDQPQRIRAWKESVGFRPEWGRAEPAGQVNGSSGRWIDEQVLGPLGFRRDKTWITDCLDVYRASKPQAKAIADRFVPFAERIGLALPDLPTHPTEAAIVREAKADHLDRLANELRDAEPTTIVTLGNAALRVMRELVTGANDLEPKLYAEPYGRRLLGEFETRSVAWYPLVHPGGRGPVQAAHRDWTWRRSDRDVIALRRRCPACRARGLVPIMYGMPTSEVWGDVRLGRIAIGGCVISVDDPDRQCIECDVRVYADGRFERPEW